MIEAVDLVKEYPTHSGSQLVLDRINFRVGRGEKLAVLGRNGAGKSTLIKLLGGVEEPTAGAVRRNMSLSWPLGFEGGFHPFLTGYDNVKFLARIYNQPLQRLLDFTEDFAELGKAMHMPLETYSTGMRARLAFGLSLGIDFDCYLIDEVILAGDQRFHRKCREALFETRGDKAMILASHAMDIVREYCTHALVLKEGRGKVFTDIETAIAIYMAL
ncbi:MAG: ABC transporter ATP-binding protein [Rhizomicrobium sp.]|nr:ABC transporter ATP-binding protein [Rhizomicrobium sp.]